MAGRCRLCTSNDEVKVIEHVAAYVWESRTERVEDRTRWTDAGATWKTAFCEMAVAAHQTMRLPLTKCGSGHQTGKSNFSTGQKMRPF